MSKPLGVQLTIGEQGPRMWVTRPTYTEDKVWDAVQAAMDEGWSIDRLVHEAQAAWADNLRDALAAVPGEFRKATSDCQA